MRCPVNCERDKAVLYAVMEVEFLKKKGEVLSTDGVSVLSF
jgi:hypothetical protein